jgi:hypothetical protein
MTPACTTVPSKAKDSAEWFRVCLTLAAGSVTLPHLVGLMAILLMQLQQAKPFKDIAKLLAALHLALPLPACLGLAL